MQRTFRRTLIAACLAAVFFGETQRARATIVSDNFYTACSNGETCGLAYNFIDISGSGTLINTGGRESTSLPGVPVVLPSAFSIYGQTFTIAYVSYLGVIQFDPSPIGGNYSRGLQTSMYSPSIDAGTLPDPELNCSGGVTGHNELAYSQYFSGGFEQFSDPVMAFQFQECSSPSNIGVNVQALLDLRTDQILLQWNYYGLPATLVQALASGISDTNPGGVTSLPAGEAIAWSAAVQYNGVYAYPPNDSTVLFTPISMAGPAIPEPRTVLLLASGLIGLVLVQRGRLRLGLFACSRTLPNRGICPNLGSAPNFAVQKVGDFGGNSTLVFHA